MKSQRLKTTNNIENFVVIAFYLTKINNY